MPDRNGWTYYQYGGIEPDDDPVHMRERLGTEQVLNVESNVWVDTHSDRISHYIETGEIMLSEITRDAIETALGVTLPD